MDKDRLQFLRTMYPKILLCLVCVTQYNTKTIWCASSSLYRLPNERVGAHIPFTQYTYIIIINTLKGDGYRMIYERVYRVHFATHIIWIYILHYILYRSGHFVVYIVYTAGILNMFFCRHILLGIQHTKFKFVNRKYYSTIWCFYRWPL